METQTIFALDLGRFNSVLCWYDPVTLVAEYRTIRSAPDDVSREPTRMIALMARLHRQSWR